MTGLLGYRGKFPQLADDVYIAPGAWVIGDVVIGRASSVWFNTVIRGDENYIHIGEQTNIQDGCVLHITGQRFPLTIGNRVTIGHGAVVHGCVVEDECLIGMRAVVLDGARIGKGSVVAAGAVVTPGFQVPPGSLVMGMPAVVKREITDRERQRALSPVQHYLELSREYMDPDQALKNLRVKGFLRS